MAHPTIHGIHRIGTDKDNEKIRLSTKALEQGLSILVVRAWIWCPIDDHPICQNTHWRTGHGFEDQRRCPHHDISWNPGEWLALSIEGEIIDPSRVRPSVCDNCPVEAGLQSPNDFQHGHIECHSDGMEKIEPAGICRGLAIARGWIPRPEEHISNRARELYNQETLEGVTVESIDTNEVEITLTPSVRTWLRKEPFSKGGTKITVDFRRSLAAAATG